MAGKAGKSGRPKSDVEVKGVYLRIPAVLLKRVEHCHWLLQRQHGPKFTQTAAFEHILKAGCEALEGSLDGSEAPVPAPNPISDISPIEISKISTLSNGTPPAYDDMLACLGEEDEEAPLALPGDVPQPPPFAPAAQTTPVPPTQDIPQHIQTIAEFAAQYDKLSLADLSKLLFDRNVYRAKDRKTGEEKVINRGTLQKWLDQARAAGVL